MALNYLALTEPLFTLLTQRATTVAGRLTRSRSCLTLAEHSKHEKSRYAYLILAEQVLEGSWDSKELPTLADFGYAEGWYTQLCSKCGSQHLAEKRASCCSICAEKALASSILGGADA